MPQDLYVFSTHSECFADADAAAREMSIVRAIREIKVFAFDVVYFKRCDKVGGLIPLSLKFQGKVAVISRPWPMCCLNLNAIVAFPLGGTVHAVRNFGY